MLMPPSPQPAPLCSHAHAAFTPTRTSGLSCSCHFHPSPHLLHLHAHVATPTTAPTVCIYMRMPPLRQPPPFAFDGSFGVGFASTLEPRRPCALAVLHQHSPRPQRRLHWHASRRRVKVSQLRVTKRSPHASSQSTRWHDESNPTSATTTACVDMDERKLARAKGPSLGHASATRKVTRPC